MLVKTNRLERKIKKNKTPLLFFLVPNAMRNYGLSFSYLLHNLLQVKEMEEALPLCSSFGGRKTQREGELGFTENAREESSIGG